MGWFDWLFRPPTEARFAQLFIAQLRQAGEARSLRFDPDNFQLLIDEEKQAGIVNLRNFYAEYCQLSPADRKQYLPQTVQAILAPRMELPASFEDIKPRLRPKIWARAGIEHTNLQSRLRGDGHGIDMPQYQVGSHLLASIVYDLPRSVRSISTDELTGWDTSYYEALEIATQNLLEEGFAYAKVGDGLYISATGDSYDASRILLTEVIRRFEVQGEIIAMVPNRDMLIVTGADDDEGLEAMISLAEQAAEAPRPLISSPLRLDGDEWVDWLPSRGHPLFDRFRLLELEYLYQEYGQQKEMLDKLYAQQGIDRFVATYSAMQAEQEGPFSYAVWSEGIETLLPRTERVMFFRPPADGDGDGEIVAHAPWHKVEKIVGHLLSSADLYPQRFLVNGFPSDEELAALGK